MGGGQAANFDHTRLKFLVRTVLAHCCASTNWFTRFKQSLKPLDPLRFVWRNYFHPGLHRIFRGGTILRSQQEISAAVASTRFPQRQLLWKSLPQNLSCWVTISLAAKLGTLLGPLRRSFA